MKQSRSEELNKIVEDLQLIREINELFEEYAREQSEGMKQVEQRIENIETQAKNANKQLTKANELSRSLFYSNIILSAVACSLCVPLVGVKCAVVLSACVSSYFVLKK